VFLHAQRDDHALQREGLELALTYQSDMLAGPLNRRVTFHGGVAKTTELFNLELVIEDRRLRLFVRDRHNHPLDTGSSSAKVDMHNESSVTLLVVYRRCVGWQAKQRRK